MRSRTAVVTVIALVAAAVPVERAVASVPPPESQPPVDISSAHAEDRVIIGFEPGVSAVERSQTLSDDVAAEREPVSAAGEPVTEVVELQEGVSVEEAISALRADPNVAFVEPDYLVKPAYTNDPYRSFEWAMQSTGANSVWSGEGTTGSRDVYVGIVDEGIQIDHPDLAANIWTNPYDPVDGIDNDGNGYVDDVHGWDFFNGDNSLFDGEAGSSIDAHGTHVAGTIGAVGNNGIGVVGVNWAVTMVPAKFMGPDGGYVSDAIAALNYLTDLKVRHGINLVATNNSWGGGGYNEALMDAINLGGDQGIVFVAAAGNDGTDNDITPHYPANYECTNGGTRSWDCVISVAAHGRLDSLAAFSQYGATTVDLVAPGVDIFSTLPIDSYGYSSGTSMAAPHVTGAIALCAGFNRDLSGPLLRSAIVDSVAPNGPADTTATHGRLDIAAMDSHCRAISPPWNYGRVIDLRVSSTDETFARLAWSDFMFREVWIEVEKASSADGVCGEFTSAGRARQDSSFYTVSGLPPGTDWCFRLRGAYGPGGTAFTEWSNVAVGRTLEIPQAYSCAPATFSWIDATAGASIHLYDDDAVISWVPFEFTFYGKKYNNLAIAANGYVWFNDSRNMSHYWNVEIPNAEAPNNYIAALWDDLDPGLIGSIRVATLGDEPNRRHVISWEGVPMYTSWGDMVSFQMVFDEGTNVITFNYLDVETTNLGNSNGASATVGMEYWKGTAGTLISYNSPSLENETSYRCTDTATLSPPTITNETLANGFVGTSYSAPLTSAGGAAPYSWSLVDGSLPPGVTLSSNGVISGTPGFEGTFTPTVQVTDADGLVARRALQLVVERMPLQIVGNSVPDGNVARAYDLRLLTVGGTGLSTWSLIAGGLPPGLVLAGHGEISGTPTAYGTWWPTVRATDANGQTATRTLQLVIRPALPSAFKKTAPTNGARSRSRVVLRLSWQGSARTVQYQYCIDTINDNQCNGTWVTTRARSVLIRRLASNTTYYWQVRAVNFGGFVEANGGAWARFTTRR